MSIRRIVWLTAAALGVAAGTHALPMRAQPTPADGPWSGTIQCVLDVQTGAYQRQETQTWTLLADAPTPSGDFRIYKAIWTATGNGSLKKSQGQQLISTTWSVNVPATPVQLAIFVRASDQKLIVRQWSAPKQVPGGIAGTKQITANGQPGPTSPVTAAASEWSFLWIDAVKENATITGSKTTNVEALPADFFFSGAPVSSATCTWRLTKEPVSTPSGVARRQPVPQLLKIESNVVDQGMNGAQVRLTGQGTHWAMGVTTADFGPDITVASLTVNSATDATAVLNVATFAGIGPRPVRITTALADGQSEVVGMPNGFKINVVLQAITAPGLIGIPSLPSTPATAEVTPTAPTTRTVAPEPATSSRTRPDLSDRLKPAITEVTPNIAPQWAENLTVTFTARLTSFVQGTSTIDLGPGVTLVGAPLYVESPTRVLGSFKIAGDAPPGPRTVTIKTGDQVVTLPDGFTVKARAAREVFLPTPESGQVGQQNLSVMLSTPQWRFFSLGATADFGPGIEVTALNVQSDFGARAVLNIAADAALGPRTVTVRRPDGRVEAFPNVFAVVAAPSPLETATVVPIIPVLRLAPRANDDSYSMRKNSTLIGGAVLVSDFGAGTTSSKRALTGLANVGGTLFFSRQSGGNVGLWKTDGTPAGTVLIKPGVVARSGVGVGGKFFFAGVDATHGQELWVSDGTAAGTTLVKDIRPGAVSAEPSEFVVAGGTLYFIVRIVDSENGPTGVELWKSDGTPAGTTMIKGAIGTHYLSPRIHLTNVAGTLYFVVPETGAHGLWKTNGTAAGTTRVMAVHLGGSGSIEGQQPLVAVGSHLFFAARKPEGDPRQIDLWKTDGTEAGTVHLLAVNPLLVPCQRVPTDLTNVNGTLFFTIFDCSTVGLRELWRSDGTVAGTVLIKGGLNPGEKYGVHIFPTAVNNTFYFCAQETSQTGGLWKSDGTTAGTMHVAPFSVPRIYAHWSKPRLFTEMNGTLYFHHHAGRQGSELWKTDGTAAGTGLVKDVVPGGASSDPGDLTAVDGILFFTASDALTDNEYRDLWAAGVAPSVAANDGIAADATPTFTVVTNPSSGALLLRTDGSFSYRPNAGFTGMDSFTYTVRVAPDTSSPATVTINVSP
jgi:ELWxxDGT repeat protein